MGPLARSGPKSCDHALLLVLGRPLRGERLGEQVHPAVHDHGRTLPDTTVRNGGRTYHPRHARPGVPPVRRRQPLLRGGGRVHPPHRPGHGQAVHAVGRRRTARSGCWWAGRSTSSSPTPRSTRSPSRAASRTTSAAATRTASTSRRCSATSNRSTEHPGYRHREARLALLDEQGMDGALLFPTLGVGMQEALRRDVPALHAAFTAFNTWLDDDWGFDRGDGRLYAAPMITFADPDLAAAEVERVLDAGRPDPRHHPRSRARRQRRLRVARPPQVRQGLGPDRRVGRADGPPRRAQRREPLRQALAVGRRQRGWGLRGLQARGVPAGGLRRPRHLRHVRRAHLPRRARAVPPPPAGVHRERCHVGARPAPQPEGRHAARCPSPSRSTRSSSSREHVWVAPYYEDDMAMLKDAIGIERLLFGTDFPHTEGLPDPTMFVKDIPTFDAAETARPSCATTSSTSSLLPDLQPFPGGAEGQDLRRERGAPGRATVIAPRSARARPCRRGRRWGGPRRAAPR